jgi:hypothetical protein
MVEAAIAAACVLGAAGAVALAVAIFKAAARARRKRRVSRETTKLYYGDPDRIL